MQFILGFFFGIRDLVVKRNACNRNLFSVMTQLFHICLEYFSIAPRERSIFTILFEIWFNHEILPGFFKVDKKV